MSATVQQIYVLNPSTTIGNNDLFYMVQSPYTPGTDTAILGSNLKALFLSSATPVTPAQGGTGVNNGTSTITIGGNFAMSGAFTFTGTLTGNTAVTFPTSGTLATTSQIPTGAALTKTNDTNVTLTLGGSPTTALVNAASLTLGWSGQLAITRGGTGVSSVTVSPTATSFAGWDANSNLSANNFLSGTALITNSGATTTLTVASAGQQIFSGATFQTVQMPVVATLVNGTTFRLVNDSSNALFVISSGSNAIVAMQPLTQAILTFNGVAGTAAASWDLQYTSNTIGVQSITGTANQVIASSSTGNITLSLPQSIATTSSPTFAALTLTAPLTLTNGGTAASLTASNGGIVYSNATTLAILAGTATAGQILRSGTSAAPSWSTATYPATAGTSGNLLTSDGVNFLSTAPAFFKSTAIQVFTSSGTYTPNANAVSIWVRAIGQGGGGGGAANSTTGASSGGGGGGGSYSEKWINSPTSQTVTIANTGGVGGTAGNNAGTAGTDASFGSLCIGKGGSAGSGAAALSRGAGGAGGVAGTGDITFVGNYGGDGGGAAVVTVNPQAGMGGASPLGGGAGLEANSTSGTGRAGSNYGSGGNGGRSFNNGGAGAGGAGSGGIIIVVEYLKV